MIISVGRNASLAKIGGILMGHTGISGARVIGQKSTKYGQSASTIRVRRNRVLTEIEVLEYCQTRLARLKQPKAVQFIDGLPRNPSGKILKRLLCERYTKEASA